MRAKRLLVGSDLILVRHQYRGINKINEKNHVTDLVGQLGYDLYEHLCYRKIRDMEDFKDESIAEDLGWPVITVTSLKQKLIEKELLLIQKFSEGKTGRFSYRVVLSKRLIDQILKR